MSEKSGEMAYMGFLDLVERGCASGTFNDWTQLRGACKYVREEIQALGAEITEHKLRGEGNAERIRAKRDRITELETEIERLHDDVRRLVAELALRDPEVGRLRADKKRLDWLEEQRHWPVPYGDGWRIERDDDSFECVSRGETLRAAIDAAMEGAGA